MVTSPPSFSSEYTERLFYPHQSIADCARIFNPAKAAKMGDFMPQAAIQEVQIAWEHKDYHSPASLFSGCSRFLWEWGMVNSEKQGSGIGY
jgi:hypothetical protein